MRNYLRSVGVVTMIGGVSFAVADETRPVADETRPVVAPGQSMRPIGTPSLVDSFAGRGPRVQRRIGSGVRPAQFQLPNDMAGDAAVPTMPSPPPVATTPGMIRSASPRPLPPGRVGGVTTPNPGVRGLSNDATPVPPPTLGTRPMTASDTPLITPPSGYTGAMAVPVYGGCGTAPIAAPGTIATAPPPMVVPAPPTLSTLPGPVSDTPGPVGPLLSFGPPPAPVRVGPGLLGQPKAYVDGQNFRNWLRYLTP